VVPTLVITNENFVTAKTLQS